MKNLIFKRKWQWEIARNIQVWHNELSCHIPYSKAGYKKFGLPTFFQLRLHNGTHSDFYYPVDNGPYNRRQF